MDRRLSSMGAREIAARPERSAETRSAGRCLRRLDQGRAMVVTLPDVLSGTPAPVYDVAASVAAGIPIDRVLAAYPSLDADKMDLAVIYAAANPPRGCPRQRAELPESAVVITNRRVSRPLLGAPRQSRWCWTAAWRRF
jgi:uncharacterized protein (DUF433 family)